MAEAQSLLDRGAFIEARDERGCTPLHLAVWEGHADVVRLLLNRGADTEVQHEELSPPLHRTAGTGRTLMVRLLLEGKADFERRNVHGFTPLHCAARNGHAESASLLIDRGADIEAKDATDSTPLHWAVAQGHMDTVRLLLKRGAHVQALNKQQWAPLHQAAWNDRHEAVRLLRDAGADLNSRDSNGHSPLHVHWTGFRGCTDTAVALMEQGADIEAPDAQGKTLLCRAVGSRQPSTALVLVAAGAVVDPFWRSPSAYSEEVAEMNRVLRLDRLSAAAENGHLGILKRTMHALEAAMESDEMTVCLRDAALHAKNRNQPEAAAFLQSALAARAIGSSRSSAPIVRPL